MRILSGGRWQSPTKSRRLFHLFTRSSDFKPKASEVLSAYIKQSGEPPWTSYFVKYKDVEDDQFGMSYFNWRVGQSNYNILRIGCFPFIKYHCTKGPEQNLYFEDKFYRFLKAVNLGIPCFMYGVAAKFLISHKEIVFLKNSKDEVLTEKLEKQIILADSHLCVALLNFLQQDFTSYFKGGWVLMKAWKVYQDSYTQISSLYKKTFGYDAPIIDCRKRAMESVRKSISSINVGASSSTATLNKRYSVPNTPDSTPDNIFSPGNNSLAADYNYNKFDVDPDIVARLMAAVSFGYGIFQLCISLLPSSYLKLIHFLGFEGNREAGLSALMFSREGDDMRGPLASLTLLWYHTIVRPFFAMDGSNVQAGVDEAELLINESQDEFGESALFLFFKGRVERLKSNIPESLKAYENAIDKSNQREIQLLCLHEVGWCYLILLDWGNAYHCFDKLRTRSKWSQSFYTYLAMVCLGALGDATRVRQLAEELRGLLKEENGVPQIKNFVSRRMKKFQSPVLSGLPEKCSCQLFLLELLYFWNALPSCNPSDLKLIVEDCKLQERELMPGLCSLIEGAVYLCAMESEKAAASFKACLEKRSSSGMNATDPDDNHDHIPAFASFELATILVQDSETFEEGKRLLVFTQNEYNGYDFEYRLTVRINSLLKRINN